MPDNYREQIGHGLAQWLNDRGVLNWDAELGYDGTTVWPTYVQQDAPKTPHQMVQIAVGTIQPVRADYLVMVQIRVRGDQDAAESVTNDRMQLILDALYPNGFPVVHQIMTGVKVGIVRPLANIDLGRDAQRRPSVVNNFQMRTRRPRPPAPPQPEPTGYGNTPYGVGGYGE